MTALHPGTHLADRIRACGFTQEQFANGSGIHFVTLNRLIRGHEPIKERFAMVLAKCFSTTPQYWLHLQADWDLEQFLAKPVKVEKGRRNWQQLRDQAKVFE